MTAQLTCRNLCLGYDGKEILHNLNFEIYAGEYLCIVGENGSGKSTLMKTVLGLQKPLSGEMLTATGCHRMKSVICRNRQLFKRIFPQLFPKLSFPAVRVPAVFDRFTQKRKRNGQ